MKTITTLDDKIVCDAVSWPPRRNDAGHWEIAVRGDPSIFDLLSDYQGCSFRVGKFELRDLVFIKREITPPDYEMEFSTMVFAGVVYSEASTTGAAVLIGGNHNG